MSAYVIVSDPENQDLSQLQDYLRLAPASVEKYGGRYVVRRGAVEILEGDWHPTLVIVEFPSADRAREWYASAEYQDIRRRHFSAKRNLVLVEGT